VITTTGAASALNVIANNNTASFTASTLTSAAGPVINLVGNNDVITLTNTTVTAGSDGRWLATSGTPDTVNAIASTLNGSAITSAGTSNLNLMNDTVWRMTGSSNVTNLANNASTINFSPPTGDPTQLLSYKTLTVNNYTGSAGVIGLNTFLGTDSSPSDRLVINGGTATGSSSLRITPTGVSGALTTGNGILVVDATNGTTAPDAFELAGEVRGGAEDYFLFRGGLNGSFPESWFLRNTFQIGGENGEGPGGGVVELPGGGIKYPTDPPPTVLPPGTYPIIGQSLATDGVVQPVARQMGLATLGTFHERIGDAAADAACLNTAADDGGITKAPPIPYGNCQHAVWGRLFGQQIDDHYRAFADPRDSGDVAGIQSGADIWRGSLIPGQSDTAGVYFAYGNGNVSVDGLVTNTPPTGYILQHTGSVNLNAFSAGGYWTHYGPTGWYIDAVLQGSFYKGNAETQFANLPINGTGFISSLEAGYPIPLPWLGPLCAGAGRTDHLATGLLR
jgi:outer membrane autotransporter protein